MFLFHVDDENDFVLDLGNGVVPMTDVDQLEPWFDEIREKLKAHLNNK